MSTDKVIIPRVVHGYLPVSLDLAVAYGVISEAEARARGWTPPPPPVHVAWRRRARWALRDWRERVGRRLGSWVAGVDLSREDDEL